MMDRIEAGKKCGSLVSCSYHVNPVNPVYSSAALRIVTHHLLQFGTNLFRLLHFITLEHAAITELGP